MPVGLLVVEGRRDLRVLRAVLPPGIVAVTPDAGGGKGLLVRRVLWLRSRPQAPVVMALRDRDFDFDVPAGGVDRWLQRTNGGQEQVGFYWRRFEIENYLLDPELADAALSHLGWWSRLAYEEQIRTLCSAQRWFLVARMALARLQRSLPERRDLHDRPDLRDWVSAPPTEEQCRDTVVRQLGELSDSVRSLDVQREWSEATAAVDAVDWSDLPSAMAQFPGKDLVSALGPWWTTAANGVDPGSVLERILLFVDDNRSATLQALPDWQYLLDQLRIQEP